MTAIPLVLCLMTGCTATGGFQPPWKKDTAAKAEGPKDSITLTGVRGLEREPVSDALRQEFDAAKRLFDEKKYAQAEPLFHKLVKFDREPNWWEFGLFTPETKTKDKRRRGGDSICEASLFYEAECQRLQKNYRSASDTYTKLLTEFTNGQYTALTCNGLFEIADYWLEPTRRQMMDYQEQLQGKRSFVMPAMYFHWDKDMPLMDAEGHATNILNTIRVHNIKGPLAEKALFMLGTINFFRDEHKEADFYFTQLFEQHPDSEFAPKAIKQSIICKQKGTGGPNYDLRELEQAKKLLMTMQGAYPELARDQKWVEMQLASMNVQQADRDFKIAEFYRRTGHPGSAYFYYELVIRRYPNSDQAKKAAERKIELRSRVEREQGAQAAPAPGNPMIQERPVTPPIAPPRTLPPGLEPGRN